MELFMKSIIQMGIFMICAQVLIHFRPNGSYEKYMKILVSIMILIQVMYPVVSLITGGKRNLIENAARFEEQMQAGMEEAKEAAEQSDQLLSQMTMEQLKEQMSREQTESEEKELLKESDSSAEASEDVGQIDWEIEKITIKIGGE
ncbi:MAG: stage III sporulation protein AF [Lachnospiraceae bacterium]|nr:stage III sporulation protein AF [Lachnospiraceae bacterium]